MYPARDRKKMPRKRQSRNLLTMVPRLEKHVSVEKDPSGEWYLIIQRNNIVERMTIRFLKQPKVRRIKLDKFGAFAIQQMEEKKNVQEISDLMLEHFGEEAEPSLPRLKKFLDILESYDWIEWEPEETE